MGWGASQEHRKRPKFRVQEKTPESMPFPCCLYYCNLSLLCMERENAPVTFNHAGEPLFPCVTPSPVSWVSSPISIPITSLGPHHLSAMHVSSFSKPALPLLSELPCESKKRDEFFSSSTPWLASLYPKDKLKNP